MTAISDETPTAEPHPSQEASSATERLRTHVATVVSRLQAGYVRAGQGVATSASVRDLAILRRGLGAASGTDVRAWAIVLNNMPGDLTGPSRGLITKPTKAERAAYTAITMYAVHQQGQQGHAMHVPGASLGEATRLISRQRARADSPGGLDEQTVERMHRVSLAHNDDLRVHALRALVTLMRGGQPPVALDYGQLAADLFLLNTSHADGVRLRWGRGLHVYDRIEHDQSTSSETTGAPS